MKEYPATKYNRIFLVNTRIIWTIRLLIDKTIDDRNLHGPSRSGEALSEALMSPRFLEHEITIG